MRLYLSLTRKWFDLIRKGEKTEEYREIKPYWIKRLCWHEFSKLNAHQIIARSKTNAGIFKTTFDEVEARNGYSPNDPAIVWKHQGTRIGKPNPAWCFPGDEDKMFFILEIGPVADL